MLFVCRSGHCIQFLVIELFRKINPPTPTPRRGGELANMTFLCRSGHPSSPIYTLMRNDWLPNMNFMCGSGHFMQFLAKEKLCELNSHPLGWTFVKCDLSVQLWTFYVNPSKMFLVNLPDALWGVVGGGWESEILCADLDISCTFHQNNFSVMATNPLPMGTGLLNLSSVHFITFNAISNKFLLANWTPTLYIGRETPIIPRRVFLITVYRESKCCVLENYHWRLFRDTSGKNMPLEAISLVCDK